MKPGQPWSLSALIPHPGRLPPWGKGPPWIVTWFPVLGLENTREIDNKDNNNDK